jgi:AbrB family looped-hinge helix DNA binding protein
METTLDKYGRIVVPKPLRDRLGIEAGTDLILEAEGDHLILRPVRQAVLEEQDGLLVSTAEVDDTVDIQSVIDDVRAERTQKATTS